MSTTSAAIDKTDLRDVDDQTQVATMPDMGSDDLDLSHLTVKRTTALAPRPKTRFTASTTAIYNVVKFIRRAPDGGYSDDDVVLSKPRDGVIRMSIFSTGDGADVGWIRFDGDVQAGDVHFGDHEQVAVPRPKFCKLMGDLPQGRVASFSVDDHTLHIDCEDSHYDLGLGDEGKVPDDDDVLVLGDQDTRAGFFDTQGTKREFDFVRRHLSNDSMRPAMMCAVIEEFRGEQVLVGTDGHGLGTAPLRGEFPQGMMMPGVAFWAVNGMHGDAVTLRVRDGDPDRYTMICGPMRFSWSSPQETFPNWRNVIPSDNEAGTWTVYSPDQMKTVIDRIKGFCEDGTRRIDIELPRGGVPRLRASKTVSSNKGVEELPFTEYSGSGAKLSFNVDYLRRVFCSLTSDPPVRLHHTEPKANGNVAKALTASDRNGRFALIMPVLREM